MTRTSTTSHVAFAAKGCIAPRNHLRIALTASVTLTKASFVDLGSDEAWCPAVLWSLNQLATLEFGVESADDVHVPGPAVRGGAGMPARCWGGIISYSGVTGLQIAA